MMIPESDLKNMIGEKEYYLKMNKTRQYPFNWAAAFFTSAWMVYRRMYGYAFAYSALFFFSYFIMIMLSLMSCRFMGLDSTLLKDFVSIYLFFAGHVITGTYAN